MARIKRARNEVYLLAWEQWITSASESEFMPRIGLTGPKRGYHDFARDRTSDGENRRRRRRSPTRGPVQGDEPRLACGAFSRRHTSGWGWRTAVRRRDQRCSRQGRRGDG